MLPVTNMMGGYLYIPLPPPLKFQILDQNAYIFVKGQQGIIKNLSPEMADHLLGPSCNHYIVRCEGC